MLPGRGPRTVAPSLHGRIPPGGIGGERSGSGRVVVGGMTLAFREAGRPDDQPMILLHGMGESALSWEPVLEELAELGHRVIAPDARGHGESDRPGDYLYEALRDDVLAVWKHYASRGASSSDTRWARRPRD
jgi:alpha-beta hydrolase superfamily lysophospholipase